MRIQVQVQKSWQSTKLFSAFYRLFASSDSAVNRPEIKFKFNEFIEFEKERVNSEANYSRTNYSKENYPRETITETHTKH